MKLILDAGGVVVYPVLGNWVYSVGLMESRAAHTLGTDAYWEAHAACEKYIREDRIIKTCEEEAIVRYRYLEGMNARLDWGFSDEELAALTEDFVCNVCRMEPYPDVMDFLPKWQNAYGLGLLSDTMPSLRNVFQDAGIWKYFDAHVFSTDIGALKPDPRMYEAILSLLDTEPSNALYVDDRASNLLGAHAMGMRAVQMARDEKVERWNGPAVKNFAELDAYAKTLC